jgi:hypothetical protein
MAPLATEDFSGGPARWLKLKRICDQIEGGKCRLGHAQMCCSTGSKLSALFLKSARLRRTRKRWPSVLKGIAEMGLKAAWTEGQIVSRPGAVSETPVSGRT